MKYSHGARHHCQLLFGLLQAFCRRRHNGLPLGGCILRGQDGNGFVSAFVNSWCRLSNRLELAEGVQLGHCTEDVGASLL
mmetsp:Transcript_13114/g.32749  ORF Transcript_13114/g.32749 Transcript_13114/m.32749 type:complete len:80 (-) Transcript_13114:34-273(-)